MVYKIVTPTFSGDAQHFGGSDINKFSQYLSGIDNGETETSIATPTTYLNNVIKLLAPTTGFKYTLTYSDITADRTITVPLLTGNDTMVFTNQSQTVSNKTLNNCSWVGPFVFSNMTFNESPNNTMNLSSTLGSDLMLFRILPWQSTVADTTSRGGFQVGNRSDFTEYGELAMKGTTGLVLNATKTGAGVLRPIVLQMDGNAIITLNTDNSINFNNRTVSNFAGTGGNAITSGGTVTSATITTCTFSGTQVNTGATISGGTLAGPTITSPTLTGTTTNTSATITGGTLSSATITGCTLDTAANTVTGILVGPASKKTGGWSGIGGTTGTSGILNGTLAAATGSPGFSSVTDANGTYGKYTPATTTNATSASKTLTTFTRRSLNPRVKFKVRVTDITSCRVYAGFTDNVAADPANNTYANNKSAFLLNLQQNGTNWQIMHNANTSTQTLDDTGVAAANGTAVTIDLVADDTNSKFTYSINGAAAVNVTSNIPATGDALGLIWGVETVTGSGARPIDVFYVDYVQDK